MKTILNATVNFGLVYVPVGVATAAKRQEMRFNQLHVDCGGRIGVQKFCKTCGVTCHTDEIVKGFEIAKDQYVVVDQAELDQHTATRSHMIELTKFVERDTVPSLAVERSYFLTPNERLHQPYEILSASMTETGLVGIGKATLWGTETPIVVGPDDGVLVLGMLFCADEQVSPSEIVASLNFEVGEQERLFANQYLMANRGELVPDDLRNESRERVMSFIDAKAQGVPVEVPAPAPEPTVTINMLDTLRKMVEV